MSKILKLLLLLFLLVNILKVDALIEPIDFNIDTNYSYCVYYFYDGIIDINNTECYYNIPYGITIDSFIPKPKEGYVLDNFNKIKVIDNINNYINVSYRSLAIGEIIPPNTGLKG